jgi:hypothetical protein
MLREFGQVDYSGANAFLNAFAHSRAGRSIGLDLVLRQWLPHSPWGRTKLGRFLLRCM